MDRLFASVTLALTLSCSASLAQIHVQGSDGSDVIIGPGGIQMRNKDGTNLNVTPGGIYGNAGGNTNVNLSPSAGSVTPKRGVKRTTTKVTKQTTSHTVSKSSTSAGGTTGSATVTLSLKEQVDKLEMSACGHTSPEKSLTDRVQKLEIDNLGKAGQGSLKDRITALATALGVNLNEKTTVQTQSTVTTTQQTQFGATPAVDAHANLSISNGGVSFEAKSNVPTITATTTTATSTGSIVIDEDRNTAAYTCNGESVTVNSSKSTIALNGTCSNVTVNGSDNNIRIGRLDALTVNGNNNMVTWSSKASPKIKDNGRGNDAFQRPPAPAK